MLPCCPYVVLLHDYDLELKTAERREDLLPEGEGSPQGSAECLGLSSLTATLR